MDKRLGNTDPRNSKKPNLHPPKRREEMNRERQAAKKKAKEQKPNTLKTDCDFRITARLGGWGGKWTRGALETSCRKRWTKGKNTFRNKRLAKKHRTFIWKDKSWGVLSRTLNHRVKIFVGTKGALTGHKKREGQGPRVPKKKNQRNVNGEIAYPCLKKHRKDGQGIVMKNKRLPNIPPKRHGETNHNRLPKKQ